VSFINIYGCAEKVKKQLHTSNLYEIADSLGVDVSFDDLGCLKGLFTTCEGYMFIVINENLEEIMMKIVLAHELGHVLLHRHLAENGQFREFSLYDMASKPEMEANIFAANILLTDKEVLSTAQEGYDSETVAKMLYVPHQLLLIKMIDMNTRGFKFNVPFVPRADFLGK
jgi:Zn-dependent peptidase ImmA (M78 family)